MTATFRLMDDLMSNMFLLGIGPLVPFPLAGEPKKDALAFWPMASEGKLGMCRMSLARELYPYITEKVDVVHSDEYFKLGYFWNSVFRRRIG